MTIRPASSIIHVSLNGEDLASAQRGDGQGLDMILDTLTYRRVEAHREPGAACRCQI